MTTLYNQIAGRSLERISALSDGVFAIAMTLLVLELRVPAGEAIHSEGDLIQSLLMLAPKFLAYLMSFLTLGIFWAGQQTQLNHFSHADRDIAWIHIAFLASIAIMPFTTALLGEFITYRTALLLYWLNILLSGLGLYWSWLYASRAGLLKESAGREVSVAVKRRIIIAQALYAIGAVLSVIDTYVSIAFILLVQLSYAVAPAIGPFGRR